MKKVSKKFIIVFVVLVLIIIGFILKKDDSNVEKESETIIVNDTNDSDNIVVEVKGEVFKPGLYILEGESRVHDLIILAGGITSKADTANLNFALKLSDGMVVYVDEKKSENNTNKISINSASLDQLMEINGIGESKARNIINYRKEHGRFNTLEELKNVSGISENLFEQIKESLCI
jgi:competence protein ComEA